MFDMGLEKTKSWLEATPAILFVITMRCILRFGKLWELNPVGAASCRDQ
jgi:hypothetical protein